MAIRSVSHEIVIAPKVTNPIPGQHIFYRHSNIPAEKIG